MSRKSKVGTESGGTWHHPRAIKAWLNNGKSFRSCNRDNLVEALRSGLVVSNIVRLVEPNLGGPK